VLVNKLTDADLPDLPVPWSQALFGAGALSAVIVVLKLLTGYHSVDRAFGLFLATLAALAFAAGGFLKMQEGDDGSTATGGTGSAPF
jgi:hypothetical protein